MIRNSEAYTSRVSVTRVQGMNSAVARSAWQGRFAVLLVLPWTLTGCFAGGGKPYQINFMAPPAFMETAEVTPFTDSAKSRPAGGSPHPVRDAAGTRVDTAGADPLLYRPACRRLRLLGYGRIVLGRS